VRKSRPAWPLLAQGARAEARWRFPWTSRHQRPEADDRAVPGGDQRLLSNAAFDFRSLGFNDRTSSVYNQTNVAWVVAEASFLGQRIFCLRPGEGVDDLHSPTLVFADRISSAQPLSTASCAGFPAFFG
jgi:hypothetical protein